MLYSKFLRKVVIPLGDLFIGSSFSKQLKKQEDTFYLSEEKLKKLSLNRLQNILSYAHQNSAHYSKFNLAFRNPEEDIKKFPILDKATLLKEQNNLITRATQGMIKNSSSGSTGLRSVVFQTKEEQSIHQAVQTIWWKWAGYKIGMPILQTGISPNRGIIKSIKDFLFRTYYLSAFSHSENELKQALNWCKNKKRVFLGGYASSLYVLSKYAEDQNFHITFNGASSWGDKLFEHYKKSIIKNFKVQVNETYGLSEGLMVAATYDLPYMYIMTPNIYLEILDDEGGEVKDGEIGNVIITSLVAKGMPLIRYRTGDLAIKLPKSEYPKNRKLQLPLLQKVIGRDTDIIKTPSGNKLVVHSFTGFFEYIEDIKQFSVVQNREDEIIINFIPEGEIKKERVDLIRKNLEDLIGESGFTISFKEVAKIENSPSGKPNIIVSNL